MKHQHLMYMYVVRVERKLFVVCYLPAALADAYASPKMAGIQSRFWGAEDLGQIHRHRLSRIFV